MRESKALLCSIEKLGIDLPSHLVKKATLSYTSMLPMERFLVETCKFPEKVAYPDSHTASLSCAATVGSKDDVLHSKN
jgi:hypothetical protein